jgi:hypothetical protein
MDLPHNMIGDVAIILGAIATLVSSVTGLIVAIKAKSSINRVESQVTPSNGSHLAGIIERSLGDRKEDHTGVARQPLPEALP